MHMHRIVAGLFTTAPTTAALFSCRAAAAVCVMQANVPTIARQQSPANLGFLANSSVDAVVSLRGLGPLPPAARAMLISEAARVLRPGCPFIFIESLQGGGSPVRPFVGGAPVAQQLSVETLEALKSSPLFDVVRWDVALEGQDPHAVGLAMRSAAQAPKQRAAADGAGKEEGAKKRPEAPKRDPTKGFANSKS